MHTRRRFRSSLGFGLLCALAAAANAAAQSAGASPVAVPSGASASDARGAVNATASDAPVVTLEALVVEAESEHDHFVQGPFLPDVQGTKINAGKKSTMIDFDALPAISGANYRQALIQTPGLVLSEESSPLLSIGYRGLEPHRAQYTQVLKDGVPIHADQFGYPEAYYVPPLATVDRIEFVRGGGSLMYGPQPGGALNYVTHRPRTDKVLGGATENTFGDDNTWESFSYLDGTSDRLGYYGYFNHRETDGFRAFNSDVELDAFNLTLALDATANSRWFVTLENYRERHGEPGGLTQAGFAANPDASTREFDRFELDRDAVTLTWERDLEAGQFTSRLWFVDYTRYSRRQRGGGFGTLPTGATATTNDIETQDFSTLGAEGRYRRDWGAEGRHVFTVGAQVFVSDSPRTDVRGSTPDATTGVTFRDSQRDLLYAPVFAENLFRFGDLSVTPGVRFETYRQTVDTNFYSATTGAQTGTRSGVSEDTVPLLGLGLAYDLPRDSQLYANVSEAYRPMLFTEAVPNSTATLVAGDLAEGSSWQADVGARSRPTAGLTLDASVFYMEFSDKIGGSGAVGDPLRNIGRIEYRGVEAAATYDFLRLAGGDGTTRLEGLFNVTVLDAEIVEDSAPTRVGNTPQYAPDHLIRTGLVYTRGGDLKIALLGTFMDNAYADDANTATRAIPAHAVWDLTGEYALPGTPLTLLAGVNNLFDESYYNRVRNDGIDPAAGRNYYVGFRAAF